MMGGVAAASDPSCYTAFNGEDEALFGSLAYKRLRSLAMLGFKNDVRHLFFVCPFSGAARLT